MIDIHSHILYGIDDGAQWPEESLAIARIYEKVGIRQVVATPHAEVDSLPSPEFAQSIRNLTDRLNKDLFEQGMGLLVFPGMEVGLDPALPKMVAGGEVLTLADSKYLLVETPFNKLPLNWEEIVFSLAAEGIVVIFAHPERSAQFGDDLTILEQIILCGAKIQVNWDSFTGGYGRRVAKVACNMARKGLIHCLATDSHDVKRRNAGNIHQIGAQLKALIGEHNLNRIAVENPARVTLGKSLLNMEIGEIAAARKVKSVGWKSWFGIGD